VPLSKLRPGYGSQGKKVGGSGTGPVGGQGGGQQEGGGQGEGSRQGGAGSRGLRLGRLNFLGGSGSVKAQAPPATPSAEGAPLLGSSPSCHDAVLPVNRN
jgi:hypothetical protein